MTKGWFVYYGIGLAAGFFFGGFLVHRNRTKFRRLTRRQSHLALPLIFPGLALAAVIVGGRSAMAWGVAAIPIVASLMASFVYLGNIVLYSLVRVPPER